MVYFPRASNIEFQIVKTFNLAFNSSYASMQAFELTPNTQSDDGGIFALALWNLKSSFPWAGGSFEALLE